MIDYCKKITIGKQTMKNAAQKNEKSISKTIKI